MAAFIPGLVLSGLYCTYIAIYCLFQPHKAPAVPVEERRVSFLKKTRLLFTSLVPPVILVLSVLGSIFFGVAPPTEAAAVGAFAAMLLALAYGRLTFRALRETAFETLKITSKVIFVAVCAFMFVGVFLGLGGGNVVEDIILSAPGGRWGAFALIMFVVFILGMFIDWLGIIFIMIPIITPIGPVLGFDTLWLAMMICVNLQMSFLTPPFAYAIFFLRGAAPPELGVTTADIIRGVIPYVFLIMIGLGLCIAFPQLILWLPSQMIR
jgi:tripartite ATP-independent transporter DctM subunit